MRWFQNRSPWVLVASLAANLFFVGLIAAALIVGPLGRPSGPPPARWMMKAAGPEAAPLIEQAMAAREAELRQASDAYRASKEEFAAALVADPVDADRLRVALDRQTVARAAMSGLFSEVFIDVAPDLPLDVRQRMAERRRHKRDHDAQKK